MSDFKRKCQLILSSGFCIPEPLTMHTGINRRQVSNLQVPLRELELRRNTRGTPSAISSSESYV